MSGVDSSGRIPTTAVPAGTRAPSSTIFPGFLATSNETEYTSRASPSSSSSNSPTRLAYLRDSPPTSAQPFLTDGPSYPAADRSSTARSVRKSEHTLSSSPKPRPRSLDLGKGQAIGLDEGLPAQSEGLRGEGECMAFASLTSSWDSSEQPRYIAASDVHPAEPTYQ